MISARTPGLSVSGLEQPSINYLEIVFRFPPQLPSSFNHLSSPSSFCFPIFHLLCPLVSIPSPFPLPSDLPAFCSLTRVGTSPRAVALVFTTQVTSDNITKLNSAIYVLGTSGSDRELVKALFCCLHLTSSPSQRSDLHATSR